MRAKNNKEISIFSIVLSIFLMIMLVVFYSLILSSSNQLLGIIGCAITFLFFLADFFYLLKNRRAIKNSEKQVMKKEIFENEKSPLETYLFASIFSHKKVKIRKLHILSNLSYELEKGSIIMDKQTLFISSKLDFQKIDVYLRYIIEVIFLDSLTFHQTESLKLEKLEKMKETKMGISFLDAEENVLANVSDISSTHKLVEYVKETYFNEVENKGISFFTIASFLLVFLNLFVALNNLSLPKIENFYIPMVFSILIIVEITSKYQEGIVLKKEKLTEASFLLNYIQTLKSTNVSLENETYLCSLGLAPKEIQEKINNMLNVE